MEEKRVKNEKNRAYFTVQHKFYEIYLTDRTIFFVHSLFAAFFVAIDVAAVVF